MDLSALPARVARRWWLVAALAGLAVLGAVTASSSSSTEQSSTIRFVLRPDTSVTNGDLPGTLEALNPDGTLVQTVLGVVRDRSMLRQAARDASLQLTPAYGLEATVQPGSTLIESTVSGPDRSDVDQLSTAYARAASNYVASSYSAYALERLSTQPGSGGSGPGGLQVGILALLVGAALGVALVAAELRFQPQVRRFLGQVETDRRVRRAARPLPQSNGKPEGEPATAKRPAPLDAGAGPRRSGTRPAPKRKQRPPRPVNGTNPGTRPAPMRHKDKR
jgi:capsular polysaccharide biosynthesis protein